MGHPSSAAPLARLPLVLLLALLPFPACSAPPRGESLEPARWRPSAPLPLPLPRAIAAAADPGAGTQTAATTPSPTPLARPPSQGTDAPGGGARTLSLQEVLELAAGQAIDPRIARERAAAARAQQRVARSAWIPELAVGGRFFRNEGVVQATAGAFLDVDKQNTFVGADIALRLDLAEAIFGEHAAAQRAVAAEHAARASDQDTRTLAALRYLELVESVERRSITDEAIAHARELVALEEARLEVGSALEVDLSRARAHLAQAEGTRVEAQRRAELASAALAELLQLHPGVRLEPAGLGPRPVSGASLDLLLEQARHERPELADARARTRAAEHEVRAAARSWLYPTIAVGASAGGFGPNLGGLENQEVYTAGLVWHLGARQLGVHARQRALLRATHLEEVRVVRRIAAEVIAAQTSLVAASRRVILAGEQVAAAEETWRLARERHTAGEGLFVEVLEAEVSLLRGRSSESTARVDEQRAYFALQRAVGGMVP